jgi:hypothetical protein
MRSVVPLLLFGTLSGFSGTSFAVAREQPAVVRLLPQGQLGDGLKSQGAPEHFVGKKLFDYMNGGAELYLAYHFKDLAVGRYTLGSLELNVALYQMGSMNEAYGIFAFAAGAKKIDLPGPNALSPNMLSFYRGRYYVRVLSQKVSKESAAAMVTLGKKVFAALPGSSNPPTEIKLLPKGSIAGTVRFLTHPEQARTIWFDGEGTLLLSPGARAVSASYPGEDDDVQLTRVSYKKPARALRVCKALSKKLGLKAQGSGGQCMASGRTPDEVFAAIRTRGKILFFSSGATDVASAEKWLSRIAR